jgi:hypothetical protein
VKRPPERLFGGRLFADAVLDRFARIPRCRNGFVMWGANICGPPKVTKPARRTGPLVLLPADGPGPKEIAAKCRARLQAERVFAVDETSPAPGPFGGRLEESARGITLISFLAAAAGAIVSGRLAAAA